MQTMEPVVVMDDISGAVLGRALQEPEVAWDIETTGLNWRSDHLATCQLAIADEVVLVQLERGNVPKNLRSLLLADGTRKVFHHAPFDLRFMSFQWHVRPVNVACTKIAAKIVRPNLPREEYSLKETLAANLGVHIDKSERLSDWSQVTLSASQRAYAASDVAYLSRLLSVLEERAATTGKSHMLSESFAYLPTRVELDLLGAEDVFSY
ncbi:ribonuclease D [Planococcus sp. APC 4015]|nr:ribonuclease D [Planococcus sp. APC 4015]